jgi:hypothetical protein
MSPAAVTILMERTLSQVRPSLRATTPCPPPIASPLIPTVGHVPPGIATPCSAIAAYRSTSRVPAPTVAVPEPTETFPMALTSTTMPVEVEYPP